MAGAAIALRDVSRRFRLGSEEVWAVRDVSLAVEPGEFLALIGRSGSGKTTLLNLIAGLDRPTEGEVEIDGARVDRMSEEELVELRRRKLGFIFQSFGLLPLLSAQENVELPLRIAGIGGRGARAREMLDLVGLGRRARHRPYELSGGEQQRVAIARALVTEPSLVLADEPTGELDSATATAVFTLIRDLCRERGVTIVTCTHDRLVMEMADRVEELEDGKLVTGHTGDVWGRVQARERSPFAAPRDDQQGTLSSLIGADPAAFRRHEADDELAPESPPEAAEPPPEPAPAPAAEPEAREETEAAEDASRWARPGQ